jgi:hypothetical protein
MDLARASVAIAALASLVAVPGLAHAQGTVNLDPLPTEYVTKDSKDKDAAKDEAPEPKRAPSGISLSVSGAVGSQVTVTNSGSKSSGK